jgi:thiosulfate/3-mercaptopyruvate sulfurtransferase
MNTPILIEPTQLLAQLDQPNLRIYDAAVFLQPAKIGYRAESGYDGYLRAHIPGAAFIDLIKTFSDTTSGLGFTLPSVEALVNAASGVGIGDENDVVLYSSGHMMWATRAWWMLRYLGHRNIRVLNGGLDHWLRAGGTTEEGDNHYPAGTLTASPRPNLFVDLQGMEAASNEGVCTVNALSRNLYTGEGDFNYGRAGHIPGSVHMHYESLMEKGAFRDPEALRSTLAAQGLMNKPRLIMYCGGGISATIDAFACLLAGHRDVAVYDGSMSEWVRAGKPLTTGVSP